MLGISQMAIAQTALVKGVLKDAQTQEGITYATVHVFRSDNMEKPVAMSVADENGNIRQEVKGTGKCVAQFSSLGKQTVRKEFTLTGEKEIDLGVILTKDDSQTLGEVNIVAQKTTWTARRQPCSTCCARFRWSPSMVRTISR